MKRGWENLFGGGGGGGGGGESVQVRHTTEAFL